MRPTVRRVIPSLLLALVALRAAPARAAEGGIPAEGDGTITLLPGFRLIPQHGLISQAQSDNRTISQKQFQPQGIAELGFAPDADFHVTISLGYGIDKYTVSDGDVSVGSFDILFGADFPLYIHRLFTLYGGGGIGYSLNTFSRNGTSTESNSTALYGEVGIRLRLTSRIALVLADRYTAASASYPALNANVNVGGNFLGLGLMFHFFSPEDKGHPHAPKD